jgi:hypothetical protein
VIVDSVDVHFLRELRGARYSKLRRLARLRAVMTRRRELRTYSRADLILAVSEADRSEILRKLPRAHVTVIPNVHVVREVVPDFDERPKEFAGVRGRICPSTERRWDAFLLSRGLPAGPTGASRCEADDCR